MSARSQGSQDRSEHRPHRWISKNPKEVRAALLPEEVGDFDREYRRVMNEARESLDVVPVNDCLDRWWRVAMSSRDPEAHRHMLDVAARAERGEPISTVSWSELKSQLGL